MLGFQHQVKKNLKRVIWGLDVGQEDWTRIKSLSLRLHLDFYSVIAYFLASY